MKDEYGSKSYRICGLETLKSVCFWYVNSLDYTSCLGWNYRWLYERCKECSLYKLCRLIHIQEKHHHLEVCGRPSSETIRKSSPIRDLQAFSEAKPHHKNILAWLLGYSLVKRY